MPTYDLGKVVGPQGPEGDTYTHPETHPASMIELDNGKNLEAFINGATEINDWNEAVTDGKYCGLIALNTPFEELCVGVVKVYDNFVIQMAWGVVAGEYLIRIGRLSDNLWGNWSKGIHNASIIASGLMSAADKTKLNGIEAEANKVTKLSQLENDKGYLSESDVNNLLGEYVTETELQDYLSDMASLGYTYGTTDLTAGESELETGKLYFVYE